MCVCLCVRESPLPAQKASVFTHLYHSPRSSPCASPASEWNWGERCERHPDAGVVRRVPALTGEYKWVNLRIKAPRIQPCGHMNANRIKAAALEADIQFTALIGVWLHYSTLQAGDEDVFMKMPPPHTHFFSL